MRNLVNRLRKEKAIVKRSLIEKTRTGITLDELVESERRLNRIETVLRSIKDSMSRYATIARIASLKRQEMRKEQII